MKIITSEDVAQWMQEQVAELSKRTGYAALTLTVIKSEEYIPAPKWSVYQGKEHMTEQPTYLDCLQHITKHEQAEKTAQ